MLLWLHYLNISPSDNLRTVLRLVVGVLADLLIHDNLLDLVGELAPERGPGLAESGAGETGFFTALLYFSLANFQLVNDSLGSSGDLK